MTNPRMSSRATSHARTALALTLSLVILTAARIALHVATQSEAPANPPTQVEHL